MEVLIDQPYIKFPPPQPLPVLQPKPYRHQQIRFLVLTLLSTVLLANEYTFNNPQALQLSIQQQLRINESQFNLLYTIIALPNILFAVCIGLVIDYFGIRVCFLLLAAGMPAFQVVVALGGEFGSFGVMLVGRFLFGMVNQCVIVVGCCFVAQWFIGKELGLALGLATTLPELGNALNSLVTPIIYEKTQSLSAPLFASVGLCTIAFICACIVTWIDIKADQADKQSGIRVVADSEIQNGGSEQFKLSDLKLLNLSYWLIALLCMFSMAQYIPFFDNANKLLQVRFCFSQITAGKNITVTYLVVGMFGFPLGWFIDKIGYRRYFAIFGMLVFAIGHFVVMVFPQCQEEGVVRDWAGVSWGLFLLGIAYCFYANCLIPAIPLVVKKKVTGTAFGLMEMLENIAMAVYPTISASIVQHAKTPQIGFRLFSLFFTVTGLLGFFLSIFLLFIDQKDKSRLDSSSKQNALTKIKIECVSDTQKTRSKKSSNARSGYRTDNDCYDTSLSSDQVQKSRKKFEIQMAKHRSDRSQKRKRESSKHSQKPKPKKSKKQSEKLENEASEQDNTDEIQDKITTKKSKSMLEDLL